MLFFLVPCNLLLSIKVALVYPDAYFWRKSIEKARPRRVAGRGCNNRLDDEELRIQGCNSAGVSCQPCVRSSVILPVFLIRRHRQGGRNLISVVHLVCFHDVDFCVPASSFGCRLWAVAVVILIVSVVGGDDWCGCGRSCCEQVRWSWDTHGGRARRWR